VLIHVIIRNLVRVWLLPAMTVLLFLSGLWGCQQKRLTEVRLESPSAKECGKCHISIYEEWKGSAHGRAWTSPRFREITDDYAVAQCLPCHAPVTVFTGGAPLSLRASRRDEGVTCITCHLDQGVLSGPMKAAPMTPHATAVNQVYRDSSLCGTCHIGTFREWEMHRSVDHEDRTCKGCHMETVHRKMTQATGVLSQAMVALHEEHDLRRHGFDVQAMEHFIGEVNFSIHNQDGIYVLRIRNNLPHSIPTGQYGYRNARLTAELLDREGQIVGRQIRDLFVDLKTALEPGEETDWLLEPRDGMQAVRVRLERLDRNGRRLMLIDEAVLPLGQL
jgi:nitrate/TMAO reductase-like tetraheme cytochrome c subunit